MQKLLVQRGYPADIKGGLVLLDPQSGTALCRLSSNAEAAVDLKQNHAQSDGGVPSANI